VPGDINRSTAQSQSETPAAAIRFQLHATTIAVQLRSGWVAAAIRGPSGSGKSDLALRCLAQPLNTLFSTSVIARDAQLVADDRTDVTVTGDAPPYCLTARAPSSIAGLLEVRGLGILTVPYVSEARLVLVVDLVGPTAIPRFPAYNTLALASLEDPTTASRTPIVADLPQIVIDPFAASSPTKLMLALVRTALTGSPVGADAAKHHRLPEGQ
jgi:HPr kinase/phosphorylase